MRWERKKIPKAQQAFGRCSESERGEVAAGMGSAAEAAAQHS